MSDHAKVRRSGLGLLLAVLVLTAAFLCVRYLLQDGDTQQPAPVGEAVRHGTSTDPGPVVRGAVGSDRVAVPAPGDGDYVFRVRFTDPAQERAGQVVIVPSGQRFTTASSARQLGVSAPGEALSVGATAIEGLGVDHGAFALVLEQTAFPFRDVGTRQYECLVPALYSLAVVCRDGLGQPVEGVRIALSGEALPRSAMHPDGARSLVLALAAGAAIHTRTSEANGRAAFGALAPGSYCFDVDCRGMALVGSPDPEQDRLLVPGAEVVLTLQPMEFLVARVDAEELLSLTVEMPSSAEPEDMPDGRQLTSQLLVIAGRWPDAQLVDARLVEPGAGGARVHTLARQGDRLADIRAEVAFRRLEQIEAPIVIPFLARDYVAGGWLRVVALDVEGRELPGLRYHLTAPSARNGSEFANRISGGSSGQQFLAPVGGYELRFTDSTLDRLIGRHAVVVKPDEVSELRVQLSQHVHSVLLRVAEVGVDRSLPGLTIRLSQSDLPDRVKGGDGVTEFGPFWVRRGDFAVDGWAPGYVVAHRDVRIGPDDAAQPYVVELPMVREK